MMTKPAVETYHEGGQWKSRRQGSERAFAVGGTKEEQVAQGRTAAKNDKVEHIVKNLDGTVGEKTSHGNDPRNIPG
jgi:hypothetical protein